MSEYVIEVPKSKAPEWAAHRKAQQERHAKWGEYNLRKLTEAGLNFRYVPQSGVLLFREEGKPSINFYINTGRWRVNGVEAETMGGGAQKFLRWYKEQSNE